MVVAKIHAVVLGKKYSICIDYFLGYYLMYDSFSYKFAGAFWPCVFLSWVFLPALLSEDSDNPAFWHQTPSLCHLLTRVRIFHSGKTNKPTNQPHKLTKASYAKWVKESRSKSVTFVEISFLICNIVSIICVAEYKVWMWMGKIKFPSKTKAFFCKMFC